MSHEEHQKMLEQLREQMAQMNLVEPSGIPTLAPIIERFQHIIVESSLRTFELGLQFGQVQSQLERHQARKANSQTIRLFGFSKHEIRQREGSGLELNNMRLFRLVLVSTDDALAGLLQKFESEEEKFANVKFADCLDTFNSQRFEILTPDGRLFYERESLSSVGLTSEPDVMVRLKTRGDIKFGHQRKHNFTG